MFRFPEALEFGDLAKRILQQGLEVKLLAELLPAIGLAFSYDEAEVAAFDQSLQEFQELAEARSRELAVYTHFYKDRQEIIIQSGLHTKATGIQKMVQWLKRSYGFRQVLVFAHGNSSNDRPMIELANQLRAQQGMGCSFWVGGLSKDAMYNFETVEELQQGVIALARRVGRVG